MPKKKKEYELYTILGRLEKISKMDDKDAGKARDMLKYYMRNSYLTAAMKREAKKMIETHWPKIKPKVIEKRHYLYAVSDGEYIKVGMSTDVNRRIKALQTGSPRRLKKMWCCYAGEDSKEAKKQEKKLHRALKNYHVSGEWFHKRSMKIIDGWRVRSLNAKHEEEAEAINTEMDGEFLNRMIEG